MKLTAAERISGLRNLCWIHSSMAEQFQNYAGDPEQRDDYAQYLGDQIDDCLECSGSRPGEERFPQ
jgi:hypothetical protein